MAKRITDKARLDRLIKTGFTVQKHGPEFWIYDPGGKEYPEATIEASPRAAIDSAMTAEASGKEKKP